MLRMKTKLFSCIAGLIFFSKAAYTQFYVKDVFFQTTGVSNEGIVAGYVEWAGPYFLWDPVSQITTEIGGTAPGNGVGGQAAFSADGNFLSGTSPGPMGNEMSRYNVSTASWTPLGSLGFTIDDSYSGGYSISGDGTTVVGNAWADTAGGVAYSEAIAWTQESGIVNLGTIFEGRSTRANAVNGDGSVIVGWQDFNGPWKSAVWRKNSEGNYLQNAYLLINPEGDSTDEYNQLGECSAISADGNWIGGHGDYATNGNPWIWSEAGGYVDLGTLAEGAYGYVAALNENGTVAVGRLQLGPWDPEIPYIWTEAGGMQNINDYAANTLGIDLGSKQIYSANCMSSNGQYIVGYGYDNITFEPFAYRLNAWVLGTPEIEKENVKLYPNPASDKVTVSAPGKSRLRIFNPEGKTMAFLEFDEQQQLDISNYEAGVYFAEISSVDSFKTIRFVKD